MTENPLGPSVTYMQYYNAGGLQNPTAKRQEIDRVGANDSVISTTTNKLLDVNSSSESYIKTLMLSCGREPRFLMYTEPSGWCAACIIEGPARGKDA